MKGKYPIEYFTNPNMDKVKSQEEIWDDIDAYTGEFFEDETQYHSKIDAFIPLPPLRYENKVTKGILFSQGLEYLIKLFPDLNKIFFLGAYSMWSSYPWCDKADFYLSCYDNKKREEYHKNKYQNKKNIIFIPLQDADYSNEYKVAPTFPVKRDIDVLMVSSPIPVKNLPIAVKAFKICKEKYNYNLKATMILGDNKVVKNEDGTIDYSKLSEYRKKILNELFEIIGDDKTLVDFHPYITYDNISNYYANSKCLVLASLIEGKNRSISEAMSANTPVVVFRDHNKWARNGFPIFPEGSGEYVEEFSPEALADTIYKVITNQQNYTPRKNYLKYSGRKNFISNLVSYLPYYKENIPDYDKTRFSENLWVDLACQANYKLSYYDFLYDRNCALSHIRGVEKISEIMKFYYSRFGIKPN